VRYLEREHIGVSGHTCKDQNAAAPVKYSDGCLHSGWLFERDASLLL
jgi:hypothetical protein